jgi:hypothetical protein
VAAAGSGLQEVMCECWAAEASDRPTFAGVEARLATALLTFETSAFKQRYAATSEVTMQHTLWTALHGLVSMQARRTGVPQARADAALLWVQRNAFTAGDNSGLQERQIDSLQGGSCNMRNMHMHGVLQHMHAHACAHAHAWCITALPSERRKLSTRVSCGS